MKFKRLERYEVAAWTPRKLALATSKPARMAKKLESTYPLIAEQLPQPKAFDADAELARRQASSDKHEASDRARVASLWRKARANYFKATAQQQQEIRTAWEGWTGPLTAFYFGYVVDVATGEFEARSQRTREASKALVAKILTQQSMELEFS